MGMSDDFYGVLGVRPGASTAEIELAIKGRRSQYHPDRYASMDAETIAWATAQMQAANEAYRILSDAALRKAFDERRAQSSKRAQGSSTASASTKGDQPSPNAERRSAAKAPEEPNILDYIREVMLEGEDLDRFHVAPHIPGKKLSAALSGRRFAQHAPPAAVHLLVDDAVFKGGATGLVISDEYLSFKSLFMEPNEFRYGGPGGWRGGLRAIKGSMHRFEKECISFACFSPVGVQRLTWALNSFFEARLQWHQAMAEVGDANSQFFVSGSTDDKAAERHWLIQAAQSGYVVAQHNLGMTLMATDIEAAFLWLSRAAAQGSKPARERLQSPRFAHLRSQ
jgi:curved DNA-binding protein